MIRYRYLFFFFIVIPVFLFAQKTTPVKLAINQKSGTKESASLLPYNRWISSAGKIVTYGDSTLENHALDVCTLPDKKFIAIEDRYGIGILNVQNNSLADRWSFQNNTQWDGAMSSYSGITSFNYNDKIFI